MSRTAPLMTLVAVGVLGGSLFVVDTMRAHDPTAAPTNTAATAPAAAGPEAPAAQPGAGGAEVDLAGVPVAGAKDGGAAPAAGGSEVDLSEVDVAGGGAAEAKAPAQDADAGTSTDDLFAGKTEDGKLTVAIGVKGNKAVAYVCDGKKVEFWLSGSATSAGLDLKDRTGKVTMNGSVEANTFSGTLTVKGKKSDYTADGTTVAEANAAGRPDVARVAEKVGL